MYSQYARVKTEKDNCLSYMGFIQSLVQVASITFPNRQGNKLLVTSLFLNSSVLIYFDRKHLQKQYFHQ